MKTNHNDAAFATPSTETEEGSFGLTKREYIAAMLLSGDAQCPGNGCFGYMKQRAEIAVQFADALISALNSKQP